MKSKHYLIAFVFGLFVSFAISLNLRIQASFTKTADGTAQQPTVIYRNYNNPSNLGPTGPGPGPGSQSNNPSGANKDPVKLDSIPPLDPPGDSLLNSKNTALPDTISPPVDPKKDPSVDPEDKDKPPGGKDKPDKDKDKDKDDDDDDHDKDKDEDKDEDKDDDDEDHDKGNFYVYDFFHPPSNATISTGIAGVQIIADNTSFPFIGWTELSMGIEIVGPCGLDPPHLHPEADEMALVISGALSTGFIFQNNDPVIMNLVGSGMATLFQRGAIHWLANLGCEPAYYVSAFNSAIPNVLNVAQNFLRIPTDVLRPSLGYPSSILIDDMRAHVPQNFTTGLDECLIRCGLV